MEWLGFITLVVIAVIIKQLPRRRRRKTRPRVKTAWSKNRPSLESETKEKSAVFQTHTNPELSEHPKAPEPVQEYPYRLQQAVFSPAERSFYGVLQLAAGEQFTILGKIRVADIITPRKELGRSQWQRAFNKISAKHFDFVLCDRDTLSIAAVVELDDKSHRNGNRAKRDDFINQASAAAGLRIIRIPARAAYSVQKVKTQILQALGNHSDPDRSVTTNTLPAPSRHSHPDPWSP